MLIELVRSTAARSPDRPIVLSPVGDLTYARCLARVESVAAGLANRGIDRVGCRLTSLAEAVVVLVASAAVGCEACLYPPGSDDIDARRFASRFDHDAVVADSTGQLGKAESLTVDQLATDEGQIAAEPQACPVLILTTGTTGEPKGVRHDWSRLSRTVRQIDGGSDSRWLLGYELNQFAGIQVFLHALVNAGTLVELPSRAPDDVIYTIRSQRVTHASATPTLWRLVAARLSPQEARELRLSQITLGGEPSPEALLTRLRSLFPAARISHVYAGTEFGSVVSVRDGHAGLPVAVLERGDDADARVRVVKGELQVRSRVGMVGYHAGKATQTKWQHTGDLVELRDGRIHFVGRTTDVVNVGGVKVHPLPVEEAVCSVEGVQIAAVYGRPNPVTGQIVVVDVVPESGVDHDELEMRIREACTELPAASRPRRIRFVTEVPTVGDKLTRRSAGPPA